MAIKAALHKGAQQLRWQDHSFLLLPEKALYWPKEEALLIADLHLGKSGHFQSHGIPVPGDVLFKDLTNLGTLVSQLQPKRLFILGDLFHSQYNDEWATCESFFKDLISLPSEPLEITLILGNHDILHRTHYLNAGFSIEKQLSLGGIHLIHDPEENAEMGAYIHGHIHPGVRLVGKGRQKLSLPCFWVGKERLVLPAFGQFTGLYMVQPEEEDHMYAIADRQVIQVL
ncbi:MAG: ligase-associated DNA damage response endonuclease PdeM [Bacteroidota bacterium]